jgi:peptidyl-dipeptidase Dcp
MKSHRFVLGAVSALALLAACAPAGNDTTSQTGTGQTAGIDSLASPFDADWATPYGVPPFADIDTQDYRPAFDQAVVELNAEIDAIINNSAAPTFENTIVALEQSGKSLTRMFSVFGNITNTDTTPQLQALEAEIYPEASKVSDAIVLNDALFQRVRAVWNQRETLGLDEQDARLLYLIHQDFERSGAALDNASKARLKEINAEISSLTTKFSQNELADTKSFEAHITDEAELAGLSASVISAGKRKAEQREKDGWVFGLDRTTFEAVMTESENRNLRRIMFDGYRTRGANGNAFDNREVARRIAELRAERAVLLGFPTHAHYQLATRMAKTPEQAEAFLLEVWRPGLARAKQERAEMQAIIAAEGGDFQLSGEDWWHYAEKLRAQKYAFDSEQLKPYFELDNVTQGAFDVATKLFGLSFTEVTDRVPGWNPVVRSYDVKDADGNHLGLFMMDMYARDSKRGGAWMSSYRQASNVAGNDVRPIITNNLNLSEPGDGEPTLLSFDEVETLFHEFGHGLHGFMTKARYERFAGTSGSPRDFTEFPAQIMEHWAGQDEVLAEYATHYAKGDVLPGELLNKLKEASTHNQGFKTTEFIAASLLDLAWHRQTASEIAAIEDVRAWELKTLRDYGLIDEIEPRYRTPYFSHIFSSADGYSAGYYSYLWSEILDADGFTAFLETGDIFNPELADRLKRNVFEAGGSKPADELYRGFRGSDPTIEPLLRIRGLQSEG